jgi:hypothetical protein
MMKTTVFLGLFVFLFSQHTTGQDMYNGIRALRDMQEGYLVVRLPGFEKKLHAIDSILEMGTLSEKSVRNLLAERERTEYHKAVIHKWYPIAFDSIFEFSRYVFIYTHETRAFQQVLIHARASDGSAVDDVLDQPYIIFTHNGVNGDPFEFSSPTHKTVSHPVARVTMPALFALVVVLRGVPDWMDAEERTVDIYGVYLHVSRLNKKLLRTYQKWIGGLPWTDDEAVQD